MPRSRSSSGRRQRPPPPSSCRKRSATSRGRWREPMRIRVALHTGEVELRDGDYFGRAVNRAARLRSLAAGGQILCSGATAELVIDSLPDDVVLADLGMRQLQKPRAPGACVRTPPGDRRRCPALRQPMRPWSAPVCPPCWPAQGRSSGVAANSSDFGPRGRPRSPAGTRRRADRRRTRRRQDAPGRRMVPSGLRARRRRPLRPLRRGPRRAVPAVRGSAAVAGALPRCQPAARAARCRSTTPTGSRTDRCPA